MQNLPSIFTTKLSADSFVSMTADQTLKISPKSRYSKPANESTDLNQVISILFKNLEAQIKARKNIGELETLRGNLNWFKEKTDQHNNRWLVRLFAWLGITPKWEAINIDKGLLAVDQQIAQVQNPFKNTPKDIKNTVINAFLAPQEIEIIRLVSRAEKTIIDEKYMVSTSIAKFLRELLPPIKERISQYINPFERSKALIQLAVVQVVTNPQAALKSLKIAGHQGIDSDLTQIVMQQAAIDPSAAKKTAGQLQNGLQKARALKAIAIKQAKTDPEAAKLTFMEARNAAANTRRIISDIADFRDQPRTTTMQDRARVLTEIALEQSEVDMQNAKRTLSQAKEFAFEISSSYPHKTEALTAIAEVEFKIQPEAAMSTLRAAKEALVQDMKKQVRALLGNYSSIIFKIASLEGKIDKEAAKDSLRQVKEQVMPFVIEGARDQFWLRIVDAEAKIDLPSAKETASLIQDPETKTLALIAISTEEMEIDKEAAIETLKQQKDTAVQIQAPWKQYIALNIITDKLSKIDIPTAKETLKLSLAVAKQIQNPRQKGPALRAAAEMQAKMDMDPNETLELSKVATLQILDPLAKVSRLIHLAIEWAKSDKEAAKTVLREAKDATVGTPNAALYLAFILEEEVKIDREGALVTFGMLEQNERMRNDPLHALEVIGVLQSIAY